MLTIFCFNKRKGNKILFILCGKFIRLPLLQDTFKALVSLDNELSAYIVCKIMKKIQLYIAMLTLS